MTRASATSAPLFLANAGPRGKSETRISRLARFAISDVSSVLASSTTMSSHWERGRSLAMRASMHCPRDSPALWAGTTTDMSSVASATATAREAMDRRAESSTPSANPKVAIERGRSEAFQPTRFAKIVRVDARKHMLILRLFEDPQLGADGEIVDARGLFFFARRRISVWIR